MDAGNLFFKKDQLSPGVTTEIASVTADIILEAFNEIGCDAFSPGSQDFALGLDMSNGYIVAMQFTNVDDTEGGVFAPLDETATPSTNSMILFSGGSWDLWSIAGATVADGEWGVKANISYSGAGVTYSVYRDGDPSSVASGLFQ